MRGAASARGPVMFAGPPARAQFAKTRPAFARISCDLSQKMLEVCPGPQSRRDYGA